MKRSIFLLAVSATVLASCSKHPDSPRHAAAVAVDEAAPQAEFGFAPATSNRLYEQPPTPDAPAAQLAEPRAAETTDSNSDPGSAIVPTDAIPVGMPKIAYVYSIGIRIAGAKVQALKQHHADLCEAKARSHAGSSR